MENLEQRLRDDAAAIDAEVSPELRKRLAASLEREAEASRARTARPRWFWWASSLTGATGALLVIALLNGLEPPHADAPVAVAPEPLSLPDLDVRPAVMLDPFDTEIENLKRDFEKARAVVRDDVDAILVAPAD